MDLGLTRDDAGRPIPRKLVGRVQAALSEIVNWPEIDLLVQPAAAPVRGRER